MIKKDKGKKEGQLHKNIILERKKEKGFRIARILLLAQESASKKQKLPSDMVKE